MRAPRHARGLRRGRSNPQEGRKPRRPQGARQGPTRQDKALRRTLPHERARSAARPIMRQESASRPGCRSGLARGGFAGPRLRPSTRSDRPRRKSHARPGDARPRSLRTCSRGISSIAAERKNESPAVSRRASCCCLWSWLRLRLAALQEQRETREGQRSGRGLGNGGPAAIGGNRTRRSSTVAVVEPEGGRRRRRVH